MSEKSDLTFRKILIFWLPLAATWLMMALEGPFLVAVIARMIEPKNNLAAFGVAFSLGVFIESPIIMLMSAATALVRDRISFIRLRNFVLLLNLGITILMIILVLPPVFSFIARDLIRLPYPVYRLAHTATSCLIPWPAAIGFRRFYQGILIRSGATRIVAYGTVVRLTTMALTALICWKFLPLSGAVIGSIALSCGVMGEAAAVRGMSTYYVRTLLKRKEEGLSRPAPSYGYIARFYYPLALTSMLSLAVMPMMTFFLGQSRLPLESLAILPVMNSLLFIFRSPGLSFQEVGVALLGDKNENRIPLKKFAFYVGAASVVLLGLIALTPAVWIWFRDISGLTMELARLAVLPTRLLAVYPGFVMLLSFQRAFFVNIGRTVPITIATFVEVVSIVFLLMATVSGLHMVGVTAAAISALAGRVLATTYLAVPYSSWFRRRAYPEKTASFNENSV